MPIKTLLCSFPFSPYKVSARLDSSIIIGRTAFTEKKKSNKACITDINTPTINLIATKCLNSAFPNI
ncbi:hypothetical protein FQP34_02450 [Peribacillus simplex]|uniref:Uncharacterized protein n=1 Tax=Peribacillus simplex TaxID=1478 RepID=A0A8B5Y4U8_9BACI|nr:hypothetical protein FQP34_02450 [Peribacillus simplex]